MAYKANLATLWKQVAIDSTNSANSIKTFTNHNQKGTKE